MARRRTTRLSIRRANACPDRALRQALRRELLMLAIDMGRDPLMYFEEIEEWDGVPLWTPAIVEAARDMHAQNVYDDGVNWYAFEEPGFEGATPEQVQALLPEVTADVVREVPTHEAAERELAAPAENPPRGDEGARGAERGAQAFGDPLSRSRAIVGRLRSGAIHSSAVALAAQLGDAAARLVAPLEPVVTGAGWIQPHQLDLARENLGDQRFVSFLLECGARVGSRIGLTSHLGRAIVKADRWTRGAGPGLESNDLFPRGVARDVTETDRRAMHQVLYAVLLMHHPDVADGLGSGMRAGARALETCRDAAGWLAQRKQQRLAEKLGAQGRARSEDFYWQCARLAQYLLGEADDSVPTRQKHGDGWVSLNVVKKWEPEARRRGVSEVARSSRGFLSAYKRAGGDPRALSAEWVAKRDGFIARHMAQVAQGGEPLWEMVRGAWRPTRRHLALLMWAFSPEPQPPRAL